MEQDVRVNPCCDIIQHDPISPLHGFEAADRRGLQNVEAPKEEKANDEEDWFLRNPEHGDEKTHDLIDHNPPIILLFPMLLGFSRNPA